MKPLDFPLLADENIHPEVVAALRLRGRDVRTVAALQLAGCPDREILRHAFALGRVVLTHDADFGALAIFAGEPYVGIVHLRPGHIRPEVVLQALHVLDSTVSDIESPFVVLVERRGASVRVRCRTGTV